MRIRDIMTPNPSVVMGDQTIRYTTALMRDRHIKVLPVIDDLCSKHLIGVVTDRDIATRGLARNSEPGDPVSDVMTAGRLAVAHVDDSPADVETLMNSRQLRRIPVLDEREHVVGIITMADLLRRHRLAGTLGLHANVASRRHASPVSRVRE